MPEIMDGHPRRAVENDYLPRDRNRRQMGRSQFFERMAIGERPVCPQFLPVRTCVAD